MTFTPDSLRAAESETQGWLQFETGEYILDVSNSMRDRVLDLMAAQGRHKAVGFIGPFDAVLRTGSGGQMAAGIDALISAAADRNVAMGRVCGSGLVSEPEAGRRSKPRWRQPYTWAAASSASTT